VFHCVLQPLCHNYADMNKLTPNISEVMPFPKWLSVKQTVKSATLKSVLYSHIWTLGTNTSPAPNFMYIYALVEHAIRNNFSFESGG
jgi:hypothetical protein